jgi:hypothetical protein
MRDTIGRLLRGEARDRSRAFAMISEAVWWVTIVDGTLVRYHPDGYDAVLERQPAVERDLIEGTLAGLRFVRNRAGQHVDHTDFIEPNAPRDGRVAAWRWASVPEPALASLPPRGQAWEASRYREYEACLAGHTIEETFGRARAFLKRAAACAIAAEPQAPAAQGGTGGPSGNPLAGRQVSAGGRITCPIWPGQLARQRLSGSASSPDRTCSRRDARSGRRWSGPSAPTSGCASLRRPE